MATVANRSDRAGETRRRRLGPGGRASVCAVGNGGVFARQDSIANSSEFCRSRSLPPLLTNLQGQILRVVGLDTKAIAPPANGAARKRREIRQAIVAQRWAML